MSTAAQAAQVRDILVRRDYALIGGIVEPRSKVLDLGCGDGELLAWLARNKQVDARGVELQAPLVQRAISKGVSVYQGDIDQGLIDYPAQAFDYVILSQTLQQVREPLKVLRDMLRVGKRIIVAFPNFGHWTVRVAHLWSGRAPKNELFPYDWYDSPNIHFFTIRDFEDLAQSEGWTIERRIFLNRDAEIRRLPNLRAESAIFQIRR